MTNRQHRGWHLLQSCILVGEAIASSTVSSNAQIVPDATLGRESSQVKSLIPGSFPSDRFTRAFIDKQEFSFEFQSQYDRLCLTLIEDSSESYHLIWVGDRLSDNPGKGLDFQCPRHSPANPSHFLVDS